MASDNILYTGGVAVALVVAAGSYSAWTGRLSLAMLRGGQAPFTGQTVTNPELSFTLTSGINVHLAAITLEGTPMTPLQVTALFTGTGNGQASRAAFAKLTAEALLVPEIKFASTGTTIVLHDVAASHVQNGMATRLSFGSGEMDVTIATQVTKFKLGQMTMTDADAGFLFASMKSGLITSDFLRYASLKWDGMSGVSGGDSSPLGITFDVGPVSAENTFEQGLPKNFEFDMSSVSISPNGALASAALYAQFGMNKLDFNMHIKGNYDWAARRMIIDEARMGFARLGAVAFKGVFGNTARAVLAADQEARMAAIQALTLESMTLRFINDGVVEKAIAWSKGRPGKGGDMTLANLPKTMLGAGGRSEDNAAVAAFLANPRSLGITIKPRAGASPLSLKALSGQKDLSWFDTQIHANN